MGTPAPPIYDLGQGIIHGAIVASPTDATVVYISGDADSQSPFDGITFRGVFSAGGTTWTRVVGPGANNTAPHSDSRAMVIDPLGNLLQGNDGGIFRLVTPSVAATRTWNAVVGNLVAAESHSGAYDPVSKVYTSGNQDNGTAFQPTPGSLSWFQWQGGDGGNVAVDGDQTAHPGTSIRYASFQFLGSFNRSSWDANGNFLGFAFLGLHIVSGPGRVKRSNSSTATFSSITHSCSTTSIPVGC